MRSYSFKKDIHEDLAEKPTLQKVKELAVWLSGETALQADGRAKCRELKVGF